VPYKKTAPTLWVDLSQIQWQDFPSVEAIVLKIEYAATSNVFLIIFYFLIFKD